MLDLQIEFLIAFSITEGGLSPEPEQGIVKNLNDETIFDHIRRKAKDFPLFGTMQTQSEPSIHKNERLSTRQIEVCSDTCDIPKWKISDSLVEDAIITSNSGTDEGGNYVCDGRQGKKMKHDMYSGSPGKAFGKLNASPGVSSTGVDISSPKMLSFDILMLKKNNETTDQRSKMEKRGQQLHSPTVPVQNQRCSLETPGNGKKMAQSFLGFESVFSFL